MVAVGVLTFFGKRIPASIKVFLLALAVADDLGAVLVIALAYTREIAGVYLFAGALILVTLAVCNQLKVRRGFFYLVAGVPLWTCFFKSGVHATVACVLLAWVMPDECGARVERALRPWVAPAIIPLFALANAGVSLPSIELTHPVTAGVVLGLVLGKQVGITLFSWLAIRLGLASLPHRASWSLLYGVACLGGIGFTMSIFVANLALGEAHLLEQAKVAILIASSISAALGVAVLFGSASVGPRTAC